MRRLSMVEQLSELQYRHTRTGQRAESERTKSREGPRMPRIAPAPDKSSPKSTSSERSKKFVMENNDDHEIEKSGRPRTAPTRTEEDILSGFEFDTTTQRPWTASDMGNATGAKVTLADLVKLDGNVDNFAHEIVENTTRCQLKDSAKVYDGMLSMIPTAFVVNVKANTRQTVYIKAKPKPERFNVKQKLTGGLVILVDPRSNLEKNTVRIKVEHKIARNIAADWYDALGTGNSYNMLLTTEVAANYDERFATRGQSRSFPGWNGRPPIWVPSPQCRVQVDTLKMSGRIKRRMSSIGESFKPKDVGFGFALPKPPVSANFLVFSAASPKAAILYMRSIMEQLWRGTVEHLTVGGGVPAINVASLHGNVDTVNELLASGANPNARRDTATEYSPLHEAVLSSHPQVITTLIRNGANQILRDGAGNTPLHLACIHNDIECIRALLADPNEAMVRRALGSENGSRLKPHQVCVGVYCQRAVEIVMKHYNLAVVKARVPISV